MGVITWGPRPTWIRTCPAWLVTLGHYMPQLLSLSRAPKPLTVKTKCFLCVFPKWKKMTLNNHEGAHSSPVMSPTVL